jgi:hypothetical protein
MSTIDNKNPITLYSLIDELEKVFEFSDEEIASMTKSIEIASMLKSIEQLSLEEYGEIRNNVNRVFQVGNATTYSSEFGCDVEFGYINDAAIEGTVALYPQSTPKDKLINHEDRVEWRNQILILMDSSTED